MAGRVYTRERLMLFKELGASAATHAADSVARIVGRDVKVSEINSGLVRLTTLMDAQNPEQDAVAVYARVQGNAPGYAVFMFPYAQAPELMYSLGSHYTNGAMNIDPLCVLQELGDILVSSVLDDIADRTGMTLRPGEMNLTVDMAAAVVSSLVAMGLESTDRALSVAFHFGGTPGIMDGLFLYLPEPGSLDAIESACSRRDIRRIPLNVGDLSWSDVQLLRSKLEQEPIWPSATH